MPYIILDPGTPIPDAQLQYDGGFYAFAKADSLYTQLLEQTPWQQNQFHIYGRTYDEPRLTCYYGDAPYNYSNILLQPLPWTDLLLQIKTDVEQASNTKFNSCLLNLYRNGSDSNGWHADNEKELGQNPVIASVSFGQERFFHIKHNRMEKHRYKLVLRHGSLLVMGGAMQHHYKHQITKTKRLLQPRINLTFRNIIW